MKDSTIVHVASYYPPHLGGLERVAKEIAEELARGGYSTTVLTSKIGAKREVVKEVPNLTVKRLWAFEFAHTPVIPTLLWHLLRIKRPALFHLHLSQAYIPEMVWLASKIRRIPYIVHFHLDVEPSGPLGFVFLWWKRHIQTRIMKDASRVIALSQDQVTLIRERYHKPENQVVCISNGVGEQFFDIGRVERETHTPLRLLFVGRLSLQKRPERLITALSLVTTPMMLTVVGEGEDRTACESLVRELGLQNVVFRGALHNQDLVDVYKEADVFILPSDREGMPLVLLEAMAAGLPVIGSDVLGIRELIEGVGVLVKDPSPETFAAALEEVARQKSLLLELSRKSRGKSAAYSWSILVDTLEKVYQELLP